MNNEMLIPIDNRFEQGATFQSPPENMRHVNMTQVSKR